MVSPLLLLAVIIEGQAGPNSYSLDYGNREKGTIIGPPIEGGKVSS